MNIQMATYKALEVNGAIYRRDKPFKMYALKPNSPNDTLSVVAIDRNAEERKGDREYKDWQPNAEDLIANDWDVVLLMDDKYVKDNYVR